jgi:hypothetical protein
VAAQAGQQDALITITWNYAAGDRDGQAALTEGLREGRGGKVVKDPVACRSPTSEFQALLTGRSRRTKPDAVFSLLCRSGRGEVRQGLRRGAGLKKIRPASMAPAS